VNPPIPPLRIEKKKRLGSCGTTILTEITDVTDVFLVMYCLWMPHMYCLCLKMFKVYVILCHLMSSYVCLCHLVILHMSSKIIKILSKSHVRHTMGPWDPMGPWGSPSSACRALWTAFARRTLAKLPELPAPKEWKLSKENVAPPGSLWWI